MPLLGAMDHSIGTMTACVVAEIDHPAVERLTSHRRLAKALWWAALVDAAILRAWLVNMGQRSAERQLAHLLCELHVRLGMVGRCGESSFDLPLTQQEIADTLGISPVHVNRVLQHMRGTGIIQFRGGRVDILNRLALLRLAEFSPTYLHLDEIAATA
jgi:CRP-like cAMP-binding protein